MQSSPYGRMLQALSAQLAQKQAPTSQTDLRPELLASGSERVQGPAPAAELIPQPAENLSEKERINQSVARASQKYNLPENLVKGVIRAESAFYPRAVSAAGAQGLMQLMPGTARELGVTDAFDIDQNIDGGARYLKQMLDRFDGDVAKALAAYNAGPGTVDRYKGKVPYRETIAYVDRVLKYSQQHV
ncbi:MAG: lytic transglycosylase domain-containing protein [Desulfobacterales bacterium]|nr:lytic transglycosylase domain-containing protein [Desulfobacterales bacterium]